MALGTEKVTNGTFDTDLSGWANEGGGVFVWDDGVATWDVSSGQLSFLTQTLSNMTNGKNYLVSFVISGMSGYPGGENAGVYFGGTGSILFTADGAYSESLVYDDSSDVISLFGGAFLTGGYSIDNVSVREVIPGVSVTMMNQLHQEFDNE